MDDFYQTAKDLIEIIDAYRVRNTALETELAELRAELMAIKNPQTDDVTPPSSVW